MDNEISPCRHFSGQNLLDVATETELAHCHWPEWPHCLPADRKCTKVPGSPGSPSPATSRIFRHFRCVLSHAHAHRGTHCILHNGLNLIHLVLVAFFGEYSDPMTQGSVTVKPRLCRNRGDIESPGCVPASDLASCSSRRPPVRVSSTVAELCKC